MTEDIRILLTGLADDELEGEQRMRAEAIVAADIDARRFVEELRAERAALARLFEPVAQEPVPARIVDTVLTAPCPIEAPRGEVIPLGKSRSPRFGGGTAWALAASLAGLALVGALYVTERGRTRSDIVAVQPGAGLIAAGELARVLEAEGSRSMTRAAPGSAELAAIRPLLTFKSRAGAWCRQFEAPGAGRTVGGGVACRQADGAWKVEMMVASARRVAGPGVVTPEGKEGIDLEAAVEHLAGGDALSPDAERQLISGGWR